MAKNQIENAEQAGNLLGDEEPTGVQPVLFEQVPYVTRFRAEYALLDEDIVFHFFRHDGDTDAFWRDAFPHALDPVARAEFRAEYPQLAASYIPEVDSWWLRAYGFGALLAPEVLIEKFLKALDSSVGGPSA